MAEKQIYTFPNGSTLVYYQQNLNKCTDVNVGFRIPMLDIPNADDYVGVYKNLVFYMDKDAHIKIPLIKPGVAHLVEHMFFSSLPDMPKSEIYSKLQRTNTEFNAETSQDYVKTEFNCPSKFVDEIFELESKMIFRDCYNKEDLENEKKPVFQELEMVKDSKVPSVLDTLTNNMETLTSEEILGIDKLVIDSFTEKQLIKFGKTYFTQQNLVMTVVSDLPFDKIKDLCEKHFVNKAPSIVETKITTPPRQYEFQNDFLFLGYPSKQSKTAQIDFILKGSKDYEKNALYSNVEDFLLNNFNGRMFEKFRNKNGLVYTPSFYTLNLPQQPLKIFSIQTTPKNVATCINTMAEILDEMLTKGITDDEYSGFKEMWENRRERKTAIKYNSAESLFSKIIYDEPVFVSEFFEKTKGLTKEEINKYLWEIYSKSQLCMFVAGNYNKNDVLPLQDILAKYRPYDKYLSKNFVDNKETDDFYDYLDYLEEHPDEESLIHFVGVKDTKKKTKKADKTQSTDKNQTTENTEDNNKSRKKQTKKTNNKKLKLDVKKLTKQTTKETNENFVLEK